MKIRRGFVSNSSSSSFVVEYLVKLEDDNGKILGMLDPKYHAAYTYQKQTEKNEDQEMQNRINISIEQRMTNIINVTKKKYEEFARRYLNDVEYDTLADDEDAPNDEKRFARKMMRKKRRLIEYIERDTEDIKRGMLEALGDRFYLIINRYRIDDNEYIGSDINLQKVFKPYHGYECEWCTSSDQRDEDDEYVPYIPPFDTKKIKMREFIKSIKDLRETFYDINVTYSNDISEEDIDRMTKIVAECTKEMKKLSELLDKNWA